MKSFKLKDEPTLLAILALILAAVALWAVSCGGGGGSYSSTPTAPSTSSATTPAAATTVSIVGTSGSAAFAPNPVQAASGATLAFKNTTSVLHHLVMDDGTLIGDIMPGATANTIVQGGGGNFHCTTHPTMVGSINGASAPPAPTPNSSGGYNY